MESVSACGIMVCYRGLYGRPCTTIATRPGSGHGHEGQAGKAIFSLGERRTRHVDCFRPSGERVRRKNGDQFNGLLHVHFKAEKNVDD